MTNKNIFHYSFIIAIITHLFLFGVWDKISSRLTSDRSKLNKIKISILEEKDDIRENNFKEEKSIKIDKASKEVTKKEYNILEEKEEFKKKSETENENTSLSGGEAEILTSIKSDLSSSDSSANFVVPDIPRGEKEGIGIGRGGEGVGEIDPDLASQEQAKIDKEKILKEYLLKIQNKIEKNKIYPQYAQDEGTEGKVKVEFIVEKNGRVKNIKVISSSGYKILDNAAMDAVKKSSPFLNISAEIERESLNMKLAIIFKLELKNY